jgi:hypothetical protein
MDLRAESNCMLGILVEAADLPSADLLPPVKDRFTATAGRLPGRRRLQGSPRPRS